MHKFQFLPHFLRKKQTKKRNPKLEIYARVKSVLRFWQLSAAGWLFLASDGKLREVSIENG